MREALVQGQIEEALEYYEDTAKALEEVRPDEEGLTRLYYNAAMAAYFSGRFQKAIDYGRKVLEISRRAAGWGASQELYGFSVLIETYRDIGQYEKSHEYIERGFERVRDLSHLGKEWERASYWEGRLYLKLGALLSLEGRYREAIAALSKGLAVSEELDFEPKYEGDIRFKNNRALFVLTLLRLGTAHRAMGALAEALKQYNRALHAIETWGYESHYDSSLYAGIGAVHMEEQRYSQALGNFRRAVELVERRHPNGREVASRLQQMGDILRKMGDVAAALPYYASAVRNVESIRAQLEFDYRGSFFGKELSPHVAAIEAFVKLGTTKEAFEYSERARSRLFLDLLGRKVELSRGRGEGQERERELVRRSTEVKEKLARGMHPDGVEKELRAVGEAHEDTVSEIRSRDEERASLMTVEPVKLREVQALLDADASLVEYFITEQGAHVWVVDRDKVEYRTIEVSRKALWTSVNRLRRAIVNFGDPGEFTQESRLLYDELIGPVLDEISGRKLVIVPHDILHYLPFHALLSPKGRYLVEDYAVHYLTSASLMKFTKAKGKKSERKRVLALGDPQPSGSEAELVSARSEVREVKRLYPRTTVLLGEEATEDSSKRLSPGYDVLHFATHAELDVKDPLSSALLLAPGHKEDGRLEVREIFAMELNADLVVLSGCETGLGKLSRGDEIAGLTRAFIYAGTPSVVATLWKVEDRSTAELMARFYGNLKKMSKAEALRQAQLAAIRGGLRAEAVAMRGVGGVTKLGSAAVAKMRLSTSRAHPYFWAAFVLVGDGS